jgi:hypothetical protein
MGKVQIVKLSPHPHALCPMPQYISEANLKLSVFVKAHTLKKVTISYYMSVC